MAAHVCACSRYGRTAPNVPLPSLIAHKAISLQPMSSKTTAKQRWAVKEAGAVNISPFTHDGYVIKEANGQRFFENVSRTFQSMPYALRIYSDEMVCKEDGEPKRRWVILGRAGDGRIALSSMDALHSQDASLDHERYQSISLQEFLIANPEYLDGQAVVSANEAVVVIGAENNDLLLVEGTDGTVRKVDKKVLIGENLSLLRDRTLLLVDKG